MHTNGILLYLLFPFALCLSPNSEPYNIRLTRQTQERECGVIPKIKHRKDFNGLLSQFGQSPWQASIFDSRDGSFFCSGTLISSRHVVTSAACLLAISSPSSLEVRLGDWDISSQDSPYETYDHFSTSVNKVVISPDFSPVVSPNQKPTVAVLKLENEVDYASYPHIAPLCLPPSLPQHHNHKSKRQFYDQCIATGWGAENYLISSGRKKNEAKTFVETPKDLENQLRPEETAYLKPVIITKPTGFSMAKTVTVSILDEEHHKHENKYGTTILVPNLYDPPSLNRETQIPDILQTQASINTQPNINPINNVNPRNPHHIGMKILDPVEEYLDLPEYIDDDEVDLETDEISVETSTHRVSLGNMPQGEESMEVMESQRQQVIVPFNYAAGFNMPVETPGYDPLETPSAGGVVKKNPIPEHESRLYRHKQKYKQGRLASRDWSATGQSLRAIFSSEHNREKRAAGDTAWRFIRRHALSNDVNININLQMNVSTVLKSVQVIFRKTCKHMRSNIPEIISISNYNRAQIQLRQSTSKACIKPANENEIANFCMLDIGSPIVCTSVHESPDAAATVTNYNPVNHFRRRRFRRNTNMFKTVHHISRHVFPAKLKTSDFTKFKITEKKKYMPTETKMYLTGIITTKQPCADENDSNFNFRDTEVASIQEILPFLIESMQK